MYKTNCCPFATANIKSGNITPNLSGQVKFYQKRGYVLVSAEIEGLPKTDSGFFGFHIHEGESCEGEDYNSVAERHLFFYLFSLIFYLEKTHIFREE